MIIIIIIKSPTKMGQTIYGLSLCGAELKRSVRTWEKSTLHIHMKREIMNGRVESCMETKTSCIEEIKRERGVRRNEKKGKGQGKTTMWRGGKEAKGTRG